MAKDVDEKTRKRRGNIAGIIAIGLTFALYSLIFKPIGIASNVLAGVVSICIASVIRVMGQGLDTSKNQKNSSSPAVQEIAKNTGNPEIDAVLEKGRDMLEDLHRQNNKIPDIEFSATISNLEGKVAKILQVIYEKPEKVYMVRKFMNYYLPTTQKMLQKYAEIDQIKTKSEKVNQTKSRIEEAVGIVSEACDKQLDILYHDDMLDISTDIEALEQMLKRDGLVDSELNKARAEVSAQN